MTPADTSVEWIKTETWGWAQGIFMLFFYFYLFNPLNAMLNPICHLLALLGAHHILHVSRIRVKSLKYLE